MPHTVAENLQRLVTARSSIATAISNKGGTVAEGAGLEDFPTAIGTIPTGSATLITKSITQNGTYNASSDNADGYSSVTVNVSGGGNADLINLIERDITSISIPSGTTKIGNYAFYGCSSLASVTIPNTVTEIGEYAFRDCSSLASTLNLSNITSFGNGVFYNCIKMLNITLPTGITSIPNHMLYGAGIGSIVIPEGVTTIGNNVFAECPYLKTVEIPSTATSLGTYVFKNNLAAQSIKFKGSTPPTAVSATFSGYPIGTTIYVPTGSLAAYQAKPYYPNPSNYTYVEY